MKLSFTYGLFGPTTKGFLLPPIWQDDWDVFHGTFLDDEFEGGSGNDVMWGSIGADTFFGGAGSDTVNYSNQGTPASTGRNWGVNVDLEDGVGYFGLAEGDRYSSVENVIGTAFNDTVVGNGAKNKILAGDGEDRVVVSDGADFLDGGGDLDTLALYWHNDVTLDLLNGRGMGGIAQGDTYLNFENAAVYGHRNTVIGTDEDNIVSVLGTEYTVETLDGDDIIYINSIVNGQIDAGDGVDTLLYINPSQAARVVFDLEDGELRHIGASGGDPRTDISGIENIHGSIQDEIFIDGRGDNRYTGGWGADVFVFDHDFSGERDVIESFYQGVYKIDLSRTAVQDFDDLENGGNRRMEQVGNDTVIYTGRDNQIVLEGLDMSFISQDDFIF